MQKKSKDEQEPWLYVTQGGLERSSEWMGTRASPAGCESSQECIGTAQARFPPILEERREYSLTIAVVAREAPAPQPQVQEEEQKEERKSVQFKVVRDADDAPVSGIKLMVKMPDNTAGEYRTGSDGMVEIKDVESDTCDVECEIEGTQLQEVCSFVGLGEQPIEDTEEKQPVSDKTCIAKVKTQKVKKDDTLAGIAGDNGMTPSELARFNWGVSSPNEINECLRTEVGCTKKDAQGNYIFDDSDDPGLIYIPEYWAERELATGQIHTIRVKGIKKKKKAVQYLRVLALDCRSGKPVKNACVRKISLGNLVTEFKHGTTGDAYKEQSKKVEGTSIKASQQALEGLGYDTNGPGNQYGDNGRRAYKKYWQDRNLDFELAQGENPAEDKRKIIIEEYNYHRATDANGILTLAIPTSLLDQKKLTAEIWFHDFAVAVEELAADTRSNPICRTGKEEQKTGFTVSWSGAQGTAQGENFGWEMALASKKTQFKVSEKLLVKDDEESFVEFDNDLFSKFYDAQNYNYHFVLFALQWCQPVYNEFEDPQAPSAGDISADTYVAKPELAGLHMHLVTTYFDLGGSDPYGGKGYGKCEVVPAGTTKWRGSNGHAGLDLHAGVNDNIFAVHAGKVSNSTTTGDAGKIAKVEWHRPDSGQISHLHLEGHVDTLSGKWVQAGTIVGHAGRSGNLGAVSRWPGHVHLNIQANGYEVGLRNKPDQDNKICIPCNDTPLLFPCRCEVTSDSPASCEFNQTAIRTVCWAVSELKCPYLGNAGKENQRLQAQLRYLHQKVSSSSYIDPGTLDADLGELTPGGAVNLQAGATLASLGEQRGNLRKVSSGNVTGWAERSALGTYANDQYTLTAPLARLQPSLGKTRKAIYKFRAVNGLLDAQGESSAENYEMDDGAWQKLNELAPITSPR